MNTTTKGEMMEDNTTQPTPQPIIPQPPVPPSPPETPASPINNPVADPLAPATPVMPSPGVAPVPQQSLDNPGKGLGIASVILGIFGLWLIGLPLGIVSLVKSRKGQASPVLGVVGIIINVIAIFLTIAAIGFLTSAFHQIQQKAQQQADQANTTTKTQQTSASYPLTANYKVKQGTNGNAYWEFPGSYSGWSITIFDQGGVNRLTRDDKAANFISYQGVDGDKNSSDALASTASITGYMQSVSGVGIGSETTMNFPEISDGKSVQFAVQEFSFVNPEKVSGKGIVAARAFDGGHILLVSYLASDATYNKSEWDALSAKVKINDNVY